MLGFKTKVSALATAFTEVNHAINGSGKNSVNLQKYFRFAQQ